MTSEEIIQRLLDEKHITVAEAAQMIRDLVKNEIFTPPTNPNKTPYYPPTVVMYGVSVTPSDDWANSIDNHYYSAVSSDKPKED